MNTILINEEGQIILKGKNITTDPLMFLNHKVELTEGNTLRSYFKMIENYSLFVRLNAFFSEYLDQYKKSPNKDCFAKDIDCLEFAKHIEMIGFPNEPRLEIYNSFYGVTANQPLDIKSYRLDGILDIPLKLGRLKHIIFGDKMDIFEFETVYTLFEFIDGIAWHLSFEGTPESCKLGR